LRVSFFSCAIAAVGEPNWAIAKADNAAEAVTSLKNALRVWFLLPVREFIELLLLLYTEPARPADCRYAHLPFGDR
jgi:hypothetical protein